MTGSDKAAFLKGSSIKEIVSQGFMLHLLLPLPNFTKVFKIWQMSVITANSCLLFRGKMGFIAIPIKMYKKYLLWNPLKSFLKMLFEWWYEIPGNILTYLIADPLCVVFVHLLRKILRKESFIFLLNVSKQSLLLRSNHLWGRKRAQMKRCVSCVYVYIYMYIKVRK